jgi:hypothetical protein
MRVWAASLAGAVTLLGGLASSATPATAPAPDLTVIGDSVMTGVLWHPKAVAIVQEGLRVHWDVAVCRALAGESCPFDGHRPPTLVQVADADGPALGRTVVVEDGYNDPEGTFGQAVDESIDALVDAGVTRILWVNLHEATPAFAGMNRVLVDAAARHPQVTLLDWNAYAAGHGDWFQNDSIHLTAQGGMGLARLLHTAVWETFDSPLTARREALPTARVGRGYAARLRVTGGQAPYVWRAVSGPLPAGLHLRPDGRIDGTPRRPGTTTVTFRVADANAAAVLTTALIRVAPA